MLQTNEIFKSALQIPDFRKLLGMNFFLTLSLMMQEVLVGYELYTWTKDPMTLGLIGLSIAFPYISVTLFAGHLADRMNKKWIMILSTCLLLLVSIFFILIFLSGTELVWTIKQKINLSYLFFGISGLARGFYQPAASSFRPYLIPRNLYSNGSTWNSTAWQLGSISGSLFAGFSYAYFGLHTSCIINSSTILLAIICLIQIKTKSTRMDNKSSGNDKLWESIKEGFVFVRNNKILLYSLALDLVAVLFAGVIALLPIFAQDILKVGAEGLGWLRAAPSIGASIGLMLMTKYSPMNKAWRNMIIAVAGFGIATIIFAISSNLLLSLFMLFLTGAFDSISVVIRGSLLQLIPPDHIRGRVLAVNNIFVSSSNEIGAFESGFMAKIMGTISSVIFGGGFTLAIISLVYLKSKELLKLKIK